MATDTQPTEVTDIPPTLIPAKVKQLIETGATKIECEQQTDNSGNWTIRAS